MDVTTMQSTNSLISQLKRDYPEFLFREADQFSWSPKGKTVYYNTSIENADSFLLHELSHGLLEHADYHRDVELLSMERDAWDKAVELGSSYEVVISDEVVESTLDSYRDWLHARSTCPHCTANGLQTGPKTYRCIACDHSWKVNEARMCALRRYSK